MREQVKIVVENSGSTHLIPAGSTLMEIAKILGIKGTYPHLAAYVNNSIREMGHRVYTPSTIRYVDHTSFAGVRTYHRTALMILQRCIEKLYPANKLHVRHSMGQNSFYCEIEGFDSLSAAQVEHIKLQMRAIIDENIPIHRQKMLTSAVREIYQRLGSDDKLQLLDTRPRLYSEIYSLDDTYGYYYGSLAPSTGYIYNFDIEGYCNGFCLALPRRDDPSQLDARPEQEKMFKIFHTYQRWVDTMGVQNVGALNSKIIAGDSSELIKIAEAFHEKEYATLADTVGYAVENKGCRIVMISGPSSSGKTTTAKRLGIQLRVLGFKPVLISLDDYFVERELTPRDENGEYDFECLEAIDIDLFNDNLQSLLAGESVDTPRYDFISGKHSMHQKPLKLDDKSILIIEGIHGLNPQLTPRIDDSLKFCIYVSCFTTVSMDNTSRISTSDNRLLRRLTRDARTRGTDALSTLKRWASVRRGEERHIFPYQENADMMFNTSLFYEIPIIKRYVAPLLRDVSDTTPEREDARRLLKFIANFCEIPDNEIPQTSILREFIGGGNFEY